MRGMREKGGEGGGFGYLAKRCPPLGLDVIRPYALPVNPFANVETPAMGICQPRGSGGIPTLCDGTRVGNAAISRAEPELAMPQDAGRVAYPVSGRTWREALRNPDKPSLELPEKKWNT